MKKLSKLVFMRTLTILVLIALPILGTDCEDIINQLGNNPCTGTNTIAGDWTLIYNAGTTNDICPGERMQLPSSTGGNAELTCPTQPSSFWLYQVTGTTLEYTETGAQYNVQFTENCEMVLSGINNNRILYYALTSSLPSDRVKGGKTPLNDVNINSAVNTNSSENKK